MARLRSPHRLVSRQPPGPTPSSEPDLQIAMAQEGGAAAPAASPLASPIASPFASPLATPIASPGASPVATIDFASLTADQRFFVAAASTDRAVIRDEFMETLVRSDVHAPAPVRATQPIRNMAEFHAAFGIGPGDPMYLPPEQRVVVW